MPLFLAEMIASRLHGKICRATVNPDENKFRSLTARRTERTRRIILLLKYPHSSEEDLFTFTTVL